MTRITIELNNEQEKKMLLKFLKDSKIPYQNEENPSPSGDKWFLDKGNIRILEEGIQDEKEGRVRRIEDPNNPWESIM